MIPPAPLTLVTTTTYPRLVFNSYIVIHISSQLSVATAYSSDLLSRGGQQFGKEMQNLLTLQLTRMVNNHVMKVAPPCKFALAPK